VDSMCTLQGLRDGRKWSLARLVSACREAALCAWIHIMTAGSRQGRSRRPKSGVRDTQDLTIEATM